MVDEEQSRTRTYWTLYIGGVTFAIVLCAMAGGSAAWVEAIAVFLTMMITGAAAVIGLGIWRQESLGRRKSEVAEAALVEAHRIALTLRAARQAVPDPLTGLGDLLPYDARLEQLLSANTIFASIAVASFRAKLFLDVDLDRPFRELEAIRADLIAGIRVLKAASGSVMTTDGDRLLQSCRQQMIGRPGDAIEQRINMAIAQIEAACRRHARFDGAG